MAVTDAKEMPALCGAWRCEFEPNRSETSNGLLGGDANAYEMGAPRFEMKFRMDHPTNADLAAMRAWVLSLRGGQVSMLAWDRKHPRPGAYIGVSDLDSVTADTTAVKADSTTTYTADETIYVWGNPQITAIDTAARTIDLSDYSSGAVVTAGDPISWFDGRNWVLVKATETKTADASGVISGLTVEPRLSAHPGITGYALPLRVRVVKAACEMRIYPSSIKIPSDYTFGGPVEFDAYQIIRRT